MTNITAHRRCAWHGIVGLLLLGVAFAAEPLGASGFRDLTWGMPQAQLEPLTTWRPQEMPRGRFTRSEEKLLVLGEQATSIRYCFRDQRLRGIEVGFDLPQRDRALYDRLSRALEAQWGAPTQPAGTASMPVTVWQTPQTAILLTTVTAGIELKYRDDRDDKALFARADLLAQRCQTELDRLRRAFPPAEAATRMRAWLKSDTTGLVAETTKVDPNLEQVWLDINDAGGWILLPHADQAPQPIEGETIATLSEALRGLRATPEAYRGRDVLLSLVVVDSVMGMGANDYWILVDRQDAKTYRDLLPLTWNGADGKPKGTPEQVAQFRKIATIRSGPTLDLPKEIIRGMATATALRGHFFDPVYPDRFIITGVVGGAPASPAKP